MKKFISLIIMSIISCSFLFSCGNVADVGKLKKTLALPIEITAQVGELCFTLTKNETASSALVIEPKTLKDLILNRKNDQFGAEYKGITVPLPAASSRRIFMLDDILSMTLKSLETGEYALETKDSNNVITTVANDIVSALTFDDQGNILLAEITVNGTKTVYVIKQSEENQKNEGKQN
ncbi:MAG: hypothetical protein RR057_03310 [Clostridia bacterium]